MEFLENIIEKKVMKFFSDLYTNRIIYKKKIYMCKIRYVQYIK